MRDEKSRWIIKLKPAKIQDVLIKEMVLKVWFGKSVSLDEALEILGIDPCMVNEAY